MAFVLENAKRKIIRACIAITITATIVIVVVVPAFDRHNRWRRGCRC